MSCRSNKSMKRSASWIQLLSVCAITDNFIYFCIVFIEISMTLHKLVTLLSQNTLFFITICYTVKSQVNALDGQNLT